MKSALTASLVARTGRAPNGPFHDRAATEAHIRTAVRTILERDGFGALGLRAVAREAGCDKKLISRYFGDLDGLLRSFLQEDGFLPSMQELCGDLTPSEVRSLPYARRARHLIRNYVRGLLARPLTRSFLSWSLVERSDFTRLVNDVAVDLNRRSFAELGLEEFAAGSRAARIAAGLMGAAMNHLVILLDADLAPPDLDLASDEGWEAVFDVIEAMLSSVMAEPGR